MIARSFLPTSLILVALGATAIAEPKPGDVFREYQWRPEGKWQRVTGPETTEPRAREFLPNAINEIGISDLDKALRVEATIEMLLCHAGTVDKRIRFNGNPSIPIPESDLIPGDSGTGPPDTEYQSMRYSEVEIPVRWDTQWIPTQNERISLAAWVFDESGIAYAPPSVENLRFTRQQTVRMLKPYDVPKAWPTRAGKTDKAKIDVLDDLSKAVDAKIVMSTWNGVTAEEIGINDRKIVKNVGKNHDQSYDEFGVPLHVIKKGTNTVYTHSKTEHHGIEVQWPGMVLFLRLDEPETDP